MDDMTLKDSGTVLITDTKEENKNSRKKKKQIVMHEKRKRIRLLSTHRDPYYFLSLPTKRIVDNNNLQNGMCISLIHTLQQKEKFICGSSNWCWCTLTKLKLQ